MGGVFGGGGGIPVSKNLQQDRLGKGIKAFQKKNTTHFIEPQFNQLLF
jgi:hypothetical protein